jgi:hypothetical protein
LFISLRLSPETFGHTLVFQWQWIEKAENKGSIICVICKQSVSLPNEYNLRRHPEPKYSDFNRKYSGKLRKQKATSLVQAMKVQQNIKKKSSDSSNKDLELQSEITHLFVKLSRPFPDGHFLNHSSRVMSQMLCITNCVKSLKQSV